MKMLKFLILVAIFASSAYGLTSEVFAILDELSQLEDMPSELHRDKRAASTNTTTASPSTTPAMTSEDVSCVTNPLRQFQEDMKSNKSGFGHLTNTTVGFEGHQFYSRLNEETLNGLCKIYVPRRTEIAKCNNSTIKSYATDAMAIFDYVCVDKYDELKKAMPCLRKADADISSKCTPKCSDAKDKQEGFTNLDSNTTGPGAAGNNTEQIRSSFTRFCTHIKCLVVCQTPIVKEQCGQSPVKLIHDGVKLLFAKLNSLNKVSSQQEYWPKVCTDMATADYSVADTSKPAAKPASG